MLGWHFAHESRRLWCGDNRLIEVGKTLSVDGPIVPYQNGLHVGADPKSALLFARGPLVCRVKLKGDLVYGRRRTVLAMADATEMLFEFACWCAETALRETEVEDRRFWNLVRLRREGASGLLSLHFDTLMEWADLTYRQNNAACAARNVALADPCVAAFASMVEAECATGRWFDYELERRLYKLLGV